MTIRHLKIFIEVAECGKMRKAAERLFISQPSVSQAIAELESYYNVKLFERLNQKIYITPYGEQLLSYARHLVDSYESLDLMMKQAGTHPILRVGGSVSVGTCLLPDIISKMNQIDPTIDLRVNINNTVTIEHMVEQSQLDVAIVEGMVKDQDLILRPVIEDELVIVAGPSHPMYQREQIKLCELEGQKLVSREEGSMERNQYEQLLQKEGIRLEPNWSSTNTEAIKKAVIQGFGLGIMSKLLVSEEIKNHSLRIIPVNGVEVKRMIQLIYHRNKYLSPQLQTFLHVVLENSI